MIPNASKMFQVTTFGNCVDTAYHKKTWPELFQKEHNYVKIQAGGMHLGK